MKVLFVNTQGGGVAYYRHTLPARHLSKAGVDVTYFDNETSFFRAIGSTDLGAEGWLLKHGGEFDVVHMGYSTIIEQITTINGAMRNYAKVAHDKDLHIALDIDDDIHSVPTYNTAFKSFTRTSDEKKALIIQLRTSDGITTTKDCLSEALRRDGKSFTTLPNYCDPTDWEGYPVDPTRDDDNSIRLMFAGGHGHYGDLATIEDEMEILMNKFDGTNGKPMLRLFWIGCTPDWAAKWMADKSDPLKNRSFYIQPAEISTYFRLLRWVSPDIFIAPIEKNIFNQSKSCIKAYDAVAANATFVCADWPTYEEVPESAAFKCSNGMEWKETLEALILDPTLRTKRAKVLEEWVLTECRIESHIYKWKDFYEKLCETPPIGDISDVVRPRIITGAMDM